jgi:hypothetical protein
VVSERLHRRKGDSAGASRAKNGNEKVEQNEGDDGSADDDDDDEGFPRQTGRVCHGGNEKIGYILCKSINSLMAPRPPVSKRLLFPALPNDAPLPALLLDPAAPHELNEELYEFIALALRAYVVPWWSKISRYDKEFLPQITRVLTTVVRVLEARISAADLPLLLYRHVPSILTQHYRDYRSATAKISTSYASGGAASLPQLFHQLQPHMALSSDGRIDAEYLRQVVDHILSICLPKEDYQPDAERFIIREVIVSIVSNEVVPRVTQPWFIERTILHLFQDAFEVPLKLLSYRLSTDSPCVASGKTSYPSTIIYFPHPSCPLSLRGAIHFRRMSGSNRSLQTDIEYYQTRAPNSARAQTSTPPNCSISVSIPFSFNIHFLLAFDRNHTITTFNIRKL